MASLDDILTTQKNGVIAINGLNVKIASLLTNTFPSTMSATIAASTTVLVYAGSGKVFSISIPARTGSAQVYVYDSATTAGISATNLIYSSLPANAAYFAPYQTVQLPFTNGLVLKTDAGMNLCVGYTPTG